MFFKKKKGNWFYMVLTIVHNPTYLVLEIISLKCLQSQTYVCTLCNCLFFCQYVIAPITHPKLFDSFTRNRTYRYYYDFSHTNQGPTFVAFYCNSINLCQREKMHWIKKGQKWSTCIAKAKTLPHREASETQIYFKNPSKPVKSRSLDASSQLRKRAPQT